MPDRGVSITSDLFIFLFYDNEIIQKPVACCVFHKNHVSNIHIKKYSKKYSFDSS